MQLKLLYGFLLLIVYSVTGIAQEKVKKLPLTEINILYDYYEQEGNNAAVTGGKGTEALENSAPMVIISTPINENGTLSVTGGIDHYTSASSANIDKYSTGASSSTESSVSGSDTRKHISIGYTEKIPNKKSSMGFSVGYSKEYDVSSTNIGISYTKSSKNQNHLISIKGSAFIDRWLLIYPGEIRNPSNSGYQDDDDDDDDDKYKVTKHNEEYEKDTRYTYAMEFSYLTNINKKLNFSINTGYTYQNGILNTPFHRVYFDDKIEKEKDKTVKSEKLPRKRFKTTIGLRLNYFMTNEIITRLFYRYYFDTFGLKAHTFSIEIPLKITSSITFYPFYRYYIQNKSDYFESYGVHNLEDEYYTSDYDLSSFTSYKSGIGIRLSPPNSIFGFTVSKSSFFRLHSLEFRYSNYKRSTELKANNFTVGSKFTF